MSAKLGRLLVLRQNNYDKVSFRDRIYFSMLLVFHGYSQDYSKVMSQVRHTPLKVTHL